MSVFDISDFVSEETFIRECLKLDKEGKLGNLNYAKKVAINEFHNGSISEDVYTKYILLSNDKTTWSYEDWCLYLGIVNILK